MAPLGSDFLRVAAIGLGLAALLGGAVGAAWGARTTSRYESVCVLDYGSGPPAAPGSPGAMSNEEWYRTQDIVLGSEAVAERVVQKLRLEGDASLVGPNQSRDPEAARRAAASALRDRIAIVPVPGTHAVRVTAQDTNPSRAAQIANAVVDAYLEKAADDRMAANQRALAWLSEQTGNTTRLLAEIELKIHQHLEQHEGPGIELHERGAILTEEIRRLTQARTEAQLSRIELTARVAKLKSAIETENPFEARSIELDGNDDVKQLRASYLALVIDREQPRTAEGADAPAALGQKKLDVLWGRMERTLRSIVRGNQGELAAIQQVENQLQNALEKASNDSRALQRQQLEYGRLSRERSQAEEWLKALRQHSSAIGVASAAGVVGARVIDPARAPATLLAPPIGSGAATGAPIGLLLGSLILAVVSQVRRKQATVGTTPAASQSAGGEPPRDSPAPPRVEPISGPCNTN